MIKCNQCGKMNATDAVNCQSCGAPLASTVDGGMSPRSASTGQPELPAWLESLRAGERSAAPANNAASFSTADFIDEDSLPSWMRAERNDARDNTGSHPPVSVRPSPLPGPAINDSYPPTSIPAQSLLDEQALPSWMREGKGAGAQSDSGSAQEKISASSLVQPDNMPDWMRSLQRNQGSAPIDAVKPSSQSAALNVPPTPQIPATPQKSSDASSAGFSARDLIDPQSLPSWIVQQGQGGQATASSPERSRASSPTNIPASSPSPVNQGQQGFSARDLIDPQSLPSWMAQPGGQTGQQARPASGELTGRPGQQNQPAQPPQPNPFGNSGQPRQPDAEQTFSASSLLDVNSLPPWLRESGQGGQGGQTRGISGPLASQPFLPPTTSTPPSSSGGNISASSFLDVNALPEWMRQADAQQPNNGYNAAPQYGQPMSQLPGSQQPNAYAGPPKVENIRVPNRPRNEVNQNENSEVAANVFASMLGVASSTPHYSAPQSQTQQPGPIGNSAQPNIGYSMNQPGTPPSAPGNYTGQGAMPNTLGNAPQGYAPGNNYSGSYQGGMNSSQMSSNNNPSFASGPGQKAADAAGEQKNAKKRGVFGAILEWLTH